MQAESPDEPLDLGPSFVNVKAGFVDLGPRFVDLGPEFVDVKARFVRSVAGGDHVGNDDEQAETPNKSLGVAEGINGLGMQKGREGASGDEMNGVAGLVVGSEFRVKGLGLGSSA